MGYATITMVKRGRYCFLAVLACVIIVVIGTLVWSPEREPVYKGKTLSEWLDKYAPDSSPTVAFESQTEAIRAIGTNALQWLAMWAAQYETPLWKSRIEDFGCKVGIVLWDKERRRSEAAWNALTVLGQQEDSAISVLIYLMTTNTPSGQL